MLDRDEPTTMVVACNGSPLVIGLGDSATFVASETTAFNRHTKEFIAMKDGEIGVLTADIFKSSFSVATGRTPAPYVWRRNILYTLHITE